MTNAVEGEVEDCNQFLLVSSPNTDVFGVFGKRNTVDSCTCPQCERLVAAIRFAPHLEKCMGMGRIQGRKASRRIASSKEGNTYASVVSDDEDEDWQGDKKKKKVTQVRSNGNKRNGKHN